jgi:hypothetical protein
LFDIVDDSSNEANSAETLDPNIALINPYYTNQFTDYKTTPNFEAIPNSTHLKSRDRFGNLNENYGITRFGAIFLDYLISATNLNKCN